MRRPSNQANNLLVPIVSLIILCLSPMPAFAYLDPGTASLLIQGVVGAVAAVGIMMKLYWHKFKLLFRGKQNKESVQDDVEEATPNE